ncbi:MAG: TIGR00725 family protein [Deltaproteobacteria bacterium]|nr:TIGR00725 family protein [Deltaproteobacteria bacterium]
MPEIMVRQKPYIIGVVGSHSDRSPAMTDAYRIGEEIARRGHVLLTGGGTGIMKAASEGAHRAGGLVVGILPNDRRCPLAGYPNDFVDIPIYTGMFDGRNVINAKTPHVLIALAGGAGTLSEIAIALKSGTPVVGLGAPTMEPVETGRLFTVSTVEEVMEQVDRILHGLAT